MGFDLELMENCMIEPPRIQNRQNREKGAAFLEALMGSVILLIVVISVMSLFVVAVAQTSARGDIGTRTALYSQDKMEQLMALIYEDATSDVTVFPTAATGGNGLGDTMTSSTSVD